MPFKGCASDEPTSENINRRYDQANYCTRTLNALEDAGISAGSAAYDTINEARTGLLSKVGIAVQRIPSLLGRIFGLSPGEISVWWDPELGFAAEAREHPGATPILHTLTQEEAIRLLRPDPDVDLAHQLFTREEYTGEG